jgi:hypothetical protein
MESRRLIESDSRHDSCGTRVAVLGLSVIVATFHFASVGPVVMFAEKAGIGRNAVRVVYSPPSSGCTTERR